MMCDHKAAVCRQYALNLDAAFYCDLDALVEHNCHIVLWCHGHSRPSCRYRIGETLIVSNQRGYLFADPNAAHFDPSAADAVICVDGRLRI
jgi:hypothetical protein